MSFFQNKYNGTAFILLLALIFLAVFSYLNLPEKIPMHFNLVGKIDRWGGKSSIFLLPIVSFFIYFLIGFVNKLPIKYLNIPVKITTKNAEKQLDLVRKMVEKIRIIILAMFLFLEWNIIESAKMKHETTYFMFIFLFFILIFAVTIDYIFKARKLQ